MAAVAPDERIEAIDVVRGIALFGVLVVNLITEFRVSIFQQFLGTEFAETALDRAVERIVSFGLEGKAFCLFALLFGAGWGSSMSVSAGAAGRSTGFLDGSLCSSPLASCTSCSYGMATS